MILERARASPELLALALLIYGLCLAIPFMPGVELGWLIMLAFGRPGIVAAWLVTIVALACAFTIGRAAQRRFDIPPWLARRIPSAGELDDFYDRTLGRTRLGRWVGRAQGSFPYLTIAVLLNLPGNAILGGGGGISMAAAFSDRIRAPGFVLTCALATLPLPILTWFGVIQVEQLLGIGG
ncbi:MAG: hypothetical protein AAGE01_25080 [Pseudomonadota bacterium]